MGFQTIGYAFVNTDIQSTQFEFSRRRKVLVITGEYLRYELGLDHTQVETPDQVTRIVNELLTRQELKSTDIVKAAQWDAVTDCLHLFVINPALAPVPEATEAPREYVILNPV